MEKSGLIQLCIATLALCGVGLCGTVLGAPPAARSGLAAFRSVPAAASQLLRLDLRPPASALPMEDKSSTVFPSSLHRHIMGASEESDLPALGTQAASGRIPGRVEEFVHRVHREGLPVARLWENKSALVSLGLNQRGKPGLWIVQKVH
jgi:hypothetical protein